MRKASILFLLFALPAAAQEVPMTPEGPSEAPVSIEADPEPSVETPARPPRRLGIGAVRTLGGLTGAELEIGLGGFALDVGAALRVDDGTTFGVGIALFMPVRLHDRVELRFGGRLAFVHKTGGDGVYPDYSMGGTELDLEAPLRLQLHLSDRLTAHAEVGPTFAIVTDGNPAGRPKGFYLLLDQPGTLATFGFTFWVD